MRRALTGWRPAALLLALLGAWELYVDAGGTDPLILPAPHAFFRNRNFMFAWNLNFVRVFQLGGICNIDIRLFLRARVEADDVSNAHARENFVAAFHFIDQPSQREQHFFRIGHDRESEMR